jgi:hypothetical protein
MHKLKHLRPTLASLLMVSSFGTSAWSQSEIGPVDIPAATITEVIRSVSKRIDRPIGITISGSYSGDSVSLHFPGGTLDSLLSQIANLRPGWTWRKNQSGDITFSASGDMRSLTDLPITLPQIKNASRKEAWQILGTDPGLKSWLAVNGCTRLDIDDGKRWKAPAGTVTLTQPSMTLAAYLLTASKQSGSNFWYVIWLRNESGCYVSLQL